MLPWLAERLVQFYGPFRLFTSRMFLIGLGTTMGALLTWYLLPRLWRLLPRDHGRADAVAAGESVGKPVGAGIVFTSIYFITCLLVLPFTARSLEILGCVLLVMVEGFMDDRSRSGMVGVPAGIARPGRLHHGCRRALPARSRHRLASAPESAVRRLPVDLHAGGNGPHLARHQRDQLHRRRGRALRAACPPWPSSTWG